MDLTRKVKTIIKNEALIQPGDRVLLEHPAVSIRRHSSLSYRSWPGN